MQLCCTNNSCPTPNSNQCNKYDLRFADFNRLSGANDAIYLKSCMQAAGTRLDLPALLIQPVQRMPRYQLLLRELIKKTPSDHVDRSNLESAMEKFTEINIFTNKKKKEADNQLKMNSVKSLISGLKLVCNSPPPPSPLDSLDQTSHLCRICSPLVDFTFDKAFCGSTNLSSFTQWVHFHYRVSVSTLWLTSARVVVMLNDTIIIAKMTKKDSPPPYDFVEAVDFSKTDLLDVDKSTNADFNRTG